MDLGVRGLVVDQLAEVVVDEVAQAAPGLPVRSTLGPYSVVVESALWTSRRWSQSGSGRARATSTGVERMFWIDGRSYSSRMYNEAHLSSGAADEGRGLRSLLSDP